MGHGTVTVPSNHVNVAKREVQFFLDNLKIRHDLVAHEGSKLRQALVALKDGSEEHMPNHTRTANECAMQFRDAINRLIVVSAASIDYINNVLKFPFRFMDLFFGTLLHHLVLVPFGYFGDCEAMQ